MQIKKGEIITIMTGVYWDRHRPMIAIQDFDLEAFTTELTTGLDLTDKNERLGVLDEILEARGLMEPIPNRQIQFDYFSDEIIITERPFQRLLFETPIR